MPVAGLYDAPSMHHFARAKSFDDSEQFLANNKQTGRVRGLPESNVSKSFAVDKEKASNVAKIKVVVCFPQLHYFWFWSLNILFSV